LIKKKENDLINPEKKECGSPSSATKKKEKGGPTMDRLGNRKSAIFSKKKRGDYFGKFN